MIFENTLKHFSYKDRKNFASDLKTIYHAPNEEIGYERMLAITKKWEASCLNSIFVKYYTGFCSCMRLKYITM